MAVSADERIKDMYDPNYFYEYGMDPSLKNLIHIVQQNTGGNQFSVAKTIVKGQPNRWFPFRSMDDIMQRELRAYTFVRCIPLMMMFTTMFGISLVQTRRLLPLGRYGYTQISHLPFYKAWGPLGVAALVSYPLVAGYIWYRALCFSTTKFYYHVVLQQRNYSVEYGKFNNPNVEYNFSDSPLSHPDNLTKEAKDALKKRIVPEPKWFK